MPDTISVNQSTPETPKFVYEPDASAGSFVMLIAQEQTPTVDGRMFSEGAIDWRELPIPLTMNRLNSAEGQHKTAIGIGSITEIWRDGNNIFGRGYFSSDSHGQEARALIKEGTISGVSADVGGVSVQELNADEPAAQDGVRKLFTRGTIIGVTALLHASFNDTKIAVEEDALTAAAARGWTPPADAFLNPNLARPTALTVTDDGRVFGHAATWGTCHVGYKDRCVTPPRSAKNYAYFNIGEVTTTAGPVPVGRITANTNHAPIEFGAQPAKDHYDHTGFAAAYVQAGEDEHGIWFSGVLAPDATEAQIANLRAAGVSGDWRNINGALEMVGLLAVNTPGFPVPRPRTAIVAGAQMALVAAGIVEGDMDSTETEFASKKKKGCSCGCNGDCADATEEMPDAEMMTVEDCGCGSSEKSGFEMEDGTPLEWTSDYDTTFLSQIADHLRQIVDLAEQGNEQGTDLALQVQSFALNLAEEARDYVEYIDRSIGRKSEGEMPEEEDDEMEDEDEGMDQEDEATNEPPAAAYSAELSLTSRLALLDLDLEMSV